MSGELLIGIDLGGTNCRVALVTPAGEVAASRRMATRIDEGAAGFMDRLTGLCRELTQAARDQGAKVVALGAGTAGVIARDGSVVVSPNLKPLNGFPFAARLRENLELPVVAINDANAIAWGEAKFGAGRSFRSFLALTLGTGVGGGLVLDGRLWEGADGAAGEAGHMTVEPEGRLCACGNRGCLEQYASASGIRKSVLQALQAGTRSRLAELPEERISSRRVAEAARQGDEVALAALEQAGRYLGQALAGIVNLLNLEGTVVAGGAAESLDLMRPALERELRQRAFEVPVGRLQVVRAELGDDAGILGAAAIARERLAEE